MEITYLGHSSFKLKGKQGTVVTDPYSPIGFSMPKVSADIVTLSHQHPDHNNAESVSAVPTREKVWIVSSPGEYEIAGISIFGYKTFHDTKDGAERGTNTVYSIILDGINIVHLGDLGHEISDEFIEKLGSVDVLLCPVGGFYTVGPEKASEIIQAIEPSYIIPMHYKTTSHSDQFTQLKTVEEFEKIYGVTSEPVKSLTLNLSNLAEQTTLIILE